MWQIKELAAEFADVWQINELVTSDSWLAIRDPSLRLWVSW